MYYLSFIFILILSACGKPAEQTVKGYRLHKPDHVVSLPLELREISGLTFYSGRFYAIQDERGVLYEINGDTGGIIGDIKFWDAGDFEGIEMTDKACYALKSNGNIYAIDPNRPGESSTDKLKRDLPKGENFEGLGYDPQGGVLLCAAKRDPGDTEKSIYAFPINSDAEPYVVHTINQKEIFKIYQKKSKGWWARFSQNVAMANFSVNPSAIATHPLTGEHYVLSSPTPQLLVFNRSWKLTQAVLLDALRFRQPEAICFDQKGNLFIANEGRGGTADLLKFNAR